MSVLSQVLLWHPAEWLRLHFSYVMWSEGVDTDTVGREPIRCGGPFLLHQHLYPESTTSPAVEAFFRSAGIIWQQIEPSCTAIARVRREERNWPSACCHVCFPCGAQTDAQSQNPLATNKDGRVTLSRWNLVYLTLQTFSSCRLLPPWIDFHMRSLQCKFSKPIN